MCITSCLLCQKYILSPISPLSRLDHHGRAFGCRPRNLSAPLGGNISYVFSTFKCENWRDTWKNWKKEKRRTKTNVPVSCGRPKSSGFYGNGIQFEWTIWRVAKYENNGNYTYNKLCLFHQNREWSLIGKNPSPKILHQNLSPACSAALASRLASRSGLMQTKTDWIPHSFPTEVWSGQIEEYVLLMFNFQPDVQLLSQDRGDLGMPLHSWIGIFLLTSKPGHFHEKNGLEKVMKSYGYIPQFSPSPISCLHLLIGRVGSCKHSGSDGVVVVRSCHGSISVSYPGVLHKSLRSSLWSRKLLWKQNWYTKQTL